MQHAALITETANMVEIGSDEEQVRLSLDELADADELTDVLDAIEFPEDDREILSVELEDLGDYLPSFDELADVFDFLSLDEDRKQAVAVWLEDNTTRSLQSAIEHMPDCYDTGATNDRELGLYLEDNGYIEIPDHIRPYFDYAAYGSDMASDFVKSKITGTYWGLSY